MIPKSIKNLCQLNKSEFVASISVGLGKIFESCEALHRSSCLLFEKGEYRTGKILKILGNEEAAKFFILLDAIQCPPEQKENLARQLEKFNEHLAKGLYSKLFEWKPDKYGTLKHYVSGELEGHYLVNAGGFSWIFRNNILDQRDSAIYVDYIQIDDYWHKWQDPRPEYYVLDGVVSYNSVIEMVRAFYYTGVIEVEALNEYAKYWRDFEFSDETKYGEFKRGNEAFLSILDEKGMLKEAPEICYQTIKDEYPFPLYKEEMKVRKVSLKSLKDRQRTENYEM